MDAFNNAFFFIVGDVISMSLSIIVFIIGGILYRWVNDGRNVHIRHLSSRPRGHNRTPRTKIDRPNDVPPSYEDVVKTTEDEQQPPSYVKIQMP